MSFCAALYVYRDSVETVTNASGCFDKLLCSITSSKLYEYFFFTTKSKDKPTPIESHIDTRTKATRHTK